MAKAAKRTQEAEPGEAPVREKRRTRPPMYHEGMVEQAAKLCLLGATDTDLADFFNVAVRTVERWRVEHPDFGQAIKDAKEVADTRVERSLYQRAIGYQVDSVKIFMPAGASEPVYAPYRETVHPDVTAQIFWLKNRKRDKWVDKRVDEQTGTLTIEWSKADSGEGSGG